MHYVTKIKKADNPKYWRATRIPSITRGNENGTTTLENRYTTHQITQQCPS